MLLLCLFFFFNDTATTEIYTLSLHDALPIYEQRGSEAQEELLPDWQRRVLGLGVDGDAVLFEQRFQVVVGKRRMLRREVCGVRPGAGLRDRCLGHAADGIARGRDRDDVVFSDLLLEDVVRQRDRGGLRRRQQHVRDEDVGREQHEQGDPEPPGEKWIRQGRTGWLGCRRRLGRASVWRRRRDEHA